MPLTENLMEEWKKAREDIRNNINSVFKKGRDVYMTDNFDINGQIELLSKFWKEHKISGMNSLKLWNWMLMWMLR